jgi:formylglycine-generating enzyme required for sulfatase activity
MKSASLTTMALAFFLTVCGCGHSESKAQGSLEAVIEARTKCARAMEDAIKELEPAKLRGFEKVVSRANEKRQAADIYLSKDDFTKAVEAYNAAAKLISSLNKEFVEKMDKAATRLSRARVLAQLSAEPAAFEKADRTGRDHETSAEGFMKAGEPARSLAELEKGAAILEKLAGPAAAGTLEQAVEARNQMIAIRSQLKTPEAGAVALRLHRRADEETGKTGKQPSLADTVRRGGGLEKFGDEALETKDYAGARASFVAARKYYQQALGLEAKRDGALAAKKDSDAARKAVNAAFKTEARPASFVRGQVTEKEAEETLAKEEFEKAKELFAKAADGYKAAQAEAEKLNLAETARAAWTKLLAEADAALMEQHAAAGFAAVKTEAESAAGLMAKEPEQAARQFDAATAKLKDLIAQARTKENMAKAVPVVARLESALSRGDKFQAQRTLAELEQLIPSDPRMSGLREKAAALPWPKEMSVDLGGGVTMDVVFIRSGSFSMGEGDEKHQVTLTKPFYMGKYEVTQEQWQAVMGSNPSNNKGAKQPVETVSWDDCQQFVAKLNEKLAGMKASLPTEAQWEYACRAGSATKFCYGDDESGLSDYAWFTSNSGNTTHPVGAKKPNAWGLYDMHGNVWEWCNDWYGPYLTNAQEDPQGPASGTHRVLRGGSFGDGPAGLTSSRRSYYTPDCRYNSLGCRVVLVAGGSAP